MPSDFEYFKNLSRKVLTHEDMINFFNDNQKAFYLDTYSSSWFNMMKAYAKANNMSSDELNKLEEFKWKDMPESLKVFAYDFCIKNGFAFVGVEGKN